MTKESKLHTIEHYHPSEEKVCHPELVDMSLLQDAARRLGSSGRPLFEYYLQLDRLRAVFDDVGHASIAERAARAELHGRVLLSAGLDILNEMHDFGVIQKVIRDAIRNPSRINKLTIEEAVRRAKAIMSEHYPDQRWEWLEAAAGLVSDTKLRAESDGQALRVTLTQGAKETVRLLSPDNGERTDIASFFSPGMNRIYVSPSLTSTLDLPTVPRSAYDTAIEGLAFAREWMYRHARNAAEGGSPARSGAGPGAVVVVVFAAGLFITLVGVTLQIACERDKDPTICALADALLPLGLLLLMLGSPNGDKSKSNSGTSFQYGTNPQ